MSWGARGDKKISLPFLGHSTGSHSRQSSHPEETRDVDANLVLTAYLRKLKTNKRKWFALYELTPEQPAHLEYHDNERRWRAGFPPKRDIILQTCLNICRKQDSRDSKHKYVIALYTLEDCVSILFEQEEEHKIWLGLLLKHQHGNKADGKIPKPNYEHLWQVGVKTFKPEFTPAPGSKTFTISGQHRIVVTPEDIKFFPIGSEEPLVYPLNCIRGCGYNDRIFKLETGTSSISGRGTIVIDCEDKEIAQNLNSIVLEAMKRAPAKKPKTAHKHVSDDKRPRSNSESNTHRHHHHHHPSSIITKSHISSATSGSTTTSTSISSHGAGSGGTHPKLENVLMNDKRPRTTSEGTGAIDVRQHYHHPPHRRATAGHFGSPLSPSPHSYLSSESAGSSNSIDNESDGAGSGIGITGNDIAGSSSGTGGSSFNPNKYTPSGEPPEAVIYEESSNESVNYETLYRDQNKHHPTQAISRLTKSSSQSGSEIVSSSSSSLKTPSSSVPVPNHSSSTNYTVPQTYTLPIEDRQQFHSPGDSVQYSLIASPPSGKSSAMDSDYMPMTPGGGLFVGSGGSTSFIEQERRRLSMLGLDKDFPDSNSSSLVNITSPTAAATSSSSRYKAASISEDESAYYPMSPEGSISVAAERAHSSKTGLPSASKSIPITRGGGVNTTTAAASKTFESSDYMVMSPSSASVPKSFPTALTTSTASPTTISSPSSSITGFSSTSSCRPKPGQGLDLVPTMTSNTTSYASKDGFDSNSSNTTPTASANSKIPSSQESGYVLMSPRDETLKLAEEEEEDELSLKVEEPMSRSGIEKRLEGGTGSAAAVSSASMGGHGSSSSSQLHHFGGARPKQQHIRSQSNSSKRASFCSDIDPSDPRWSPGPDWTRSAQMDMENYVDDPDVDYVPIVYSSGSQNPSHLQQQSYQLSSSSNLSSSLTSYHPGGVPCPPNPGRSSRVSPASSSSVISGTPSSESRFPQEFHLDKVASYLRESDSATTSKPVPLKAFPPSSAQGGSASSNSNSELSKYVPASSTSSSALKPKKDGAAAAADSKSSLKGMDIPSSSSCAGSKSGTNSNSSLLLLGKTPPAAGGGVGVSSSQSGHSPNLAARFDQWFRNRAGSVPTRPPFFERKRHRTQSEGEKDNE